MSRWFKVLVLCCAMGLLPACSEEPPNSKENKSAATESQAGTSSSVTITARNDSRAGETLLLLPLQPTARDCLQVIVQGAAAQAKFQWFINGEEVPKQDGSSLCNKTLKRDDQVEVRIINGESKAVVTIINSPPEIVDVATTSGQALQRGDLKVKAKVDDPDDDVVELQYRWLINGEPDPLSETDTLSGNRYHKGDAIQIEITPNDGIETGETFTSVIIPIPNALPKITSEPSVSFNNGRYAYQVTAEDPDGDTLNYHLEAAPPGMTISKTGLIQWSTGDVPAGTYSVTVAVEDPEGAKAVQKFSMTLENPE